jgi:hypothetical protein
MTKVMLHSHDIVANQEYALSLLQTIFPNERISKITIPAW